VWRVEPRNETTGESGGDAGRALVHVRVVLPPVVPSEHVSDLRPPGGGASRGHQILLREGCLLRSSDWLRPRRGDVQNRPPVLAQLHRQRS